MSKKFALICFKKYSHGYCPANKIGVKNCKNPGCGNDHGKSQLGHGKSLKSHGISLEIKIFWEPCNQE